VIELYLLYNRFVNELKRGPASNASERVEKDGDAVVQDGEEEKKDQ
jgi:hypothetical protein